MIFYLIHILGEQIVRGCQPYELREGCFDDEELRKEFKKAEVAGAMEINRLPRIDDVEGCICKKDLCNSAPVAGTSTFIPIIYVAFLQNYY